MTSLKEQRIIQNKLSDPFLARGADFFTIEKNYCMCYNKMIRRLYMKTRIDETIERRHKGYNCAQSIVCTYADKVGIDEKTMFRMTEALGTGLGNMEGTCGAVTGACILAGLINSSGNTDKPDSKVNTYKVSKEIVNRFKNDNGSITCKELKGIGKEKPLCSCEQCIRDAAKITEDILFKD